MTNVQMCDKLDRAIDLLTVLDGFFLAADSDASVCKGGLQLIVEEIFKNVSEVYETIDAHREAEAEIKRSEVAAEAMTA